MGVGYSVVLVVSQWSSDKVQSKSCRGNICWKSVYVRGVQKMVRLDTKDNPITKREEKLQEMQDALNNLQGNILRGHGRKNSVNLFLRFQAGKETDARELIRYLAENGTITSALKQGHQSEKKKQDRHSLFCSLFLSAEGYRYLAPALLPEFSKEFQGGIKGARK